MAEQQGNTSAAARARRQLLIDLNSAGRLLHAGLWLCHEPIYIAVATAGRTYFADGCSDAELAAALEDVQQDWRRLPKWERDARERATAPVAERPDTCVRDDSGNVLFATPRT